MNHAPSPSRLDTSIRPWCKSGDGSGYPQAQTHAAEVAPGRIGLPPFVEDFFHLIAADADAVVGHVDFRIVLISLQRHREQSRLHG